MTDNQLCADRAAGNDGVSCACRQGSAGGCWRGPGRATRMRRRSGGERSKAKRSARKAAARLLIALVGFGLVGVSSAFARRKRVKANRTDTGFN